jgi:DNA-binding transcriptional ArsR family regulator
MEFWQRVGPKREKYLAEERQRLTAADPDEVRRQWGWFYKSGRELNADLHESSSASTMNRALKALTRAGILDAQTQPCRGKGRTLFYRLNLRVYRDCLRSVGAELSAEWLDLLKPDDAAPVRAGP